MSISDLGALIRLDPDSAKARILAALAEHKGDRKAAADAVGTTHRTFYRYVEKLRLWDEIDKLAKESGFPQVPGPPRISKRIRDAVITADGNLVRASRILGMRIDALRSRINELGLLEDLNRLLKTAGLSPLPESDPSKNEHAA